VDSKFIFKADCTTMILSISNNNAKSDSESYNKSNAQLVLGGDEGYVKMFNVNYANNYSNIKPKIEYNLNETNISMEKNNLNII